MNDIQSFFVAGFEASTMRRADGRRNDLVSATRHDELAMRDYGRLKSVGITTVREGTAWHRMQPRPGTFDPSSVIGRIRAAEALGMQVIWDLCHFGWPDDMDPFDPTFADRFASFAGSFASLLRNETDQVPWYVPVNEPSFVAWAGGDVAYLNPFQRGRGDALKRELVRAAIAAAAAVREVDARARICHVDPLIHIEPAADDFESRIRVTRHNEAQFDAWDMLAGRRDDDLGGSDAQLDVIGVNFYDRNEWVDDGPILCPGDDGYRPLRDLLADLHARYRRPILVAETGTEGDGRAPWLRAICDEAEAAQGAGVPIEGICLYPAVDHPGWDDDRHLPVGLWGYPDAAGERPAYQPLIDEVRRQSARFAATAPAEPAPTPRAVGPGAVARRSQGALAICLATDSRDPSGMGRVILTLGRGLAQLGHQVTIAAPDAIDAHWLLGAAVRDGLRAWALPDASPWAQAAALGDRLDAVPMDIVNVHAGIGWEGLQATAAGRRSGAIVVRTEHLPFLLTKPADRSAFSGSLANVDALIAVSGGVAESLVGAGVPDDLVRVVRNGIDEPGRLADRQATRRSLGIGEGDRLVVSVGRLTPQKGYDVLLRAIRDLVGAVVNLRAVIVGSGPLELVLRRSIEDGGLSAIVQLLPRYDDVPSLLAASDVVVLASRFEGLPLVALEAMAVGRPLVGTRVCGIEEAIVDGSTGRLVPPDNPAALADALRDVLGDVPRGRGHGEAGRRRFSAEFTAARMAVQTAEVFASALRRRRPPETMAARHGSKRPEPVMSR